MASVLLLSAYTTRDAHHARDELARLQASAAMDIRGRHTLTDDAGAADLIVFVESGGGTRYFDRVARHPYVAAYREKTFLFTTVDDTVPVLPGVYAALPRSRYTSQRVRTGHYPRVFTTDYLKRDVPAGDASYLFSFIGNARNHPVRQRMHEMDLARGFYRDTSAQWPYVELAPEAQRQLEDEYVRVMRQSTFVLAPRGRAPSSYRLFEAMCLGRAPVIIADDWVPPEGPDWEAFSIRVAERDVRHIPRILAEREAEAEQMGRRAASAWQAWFSEAATFDSVVEWCLAIQRSRRLPESVLRWSAYVHVLSPRHFRRFLIRRNLQRLKHRLRPSLA